MSSPTFSFDFSAIQPLLNRTMQAYDWRLGRLPKDAAQGDIAFKEWAKNQRQRRGLDLMRAMEEPRQAMVRENMAERQMAMQASDRNYARQQERAALLASIRAASELNTPNYLSGYNPFNSSGPVRDHYTYGPYSQGGRGGGGSAGGGPVSDTPPDDWMARNCKSNPFTPGCPRQDQQMWNPYGGGG